MIYFATNQMVAWCFMGCNNSPWHDDGRCSLLQPFNSYYQSKEKIPSKDLYDDDDKDPNKQMS